MYRTNNNNVLLITVDCLRADRLGTSRYSTNVTRNIDRIASEGLLFTQAYSVAPWTTPSLVSILTSTYPLMFGGNLSITSNRTSVVEVLKRAGYKTFGLTYHPWLSKASGFGKGFDIYKDGTETYLRHHPKYPLLDRMIFMVKSFVMRLFDRLGLSLAWQILRSKGSFVDAIQMTDEAMKLISDLGKQPFFLWIHYLDPHWVDIPHQIPAKFLKLNRIRFALLSLRRERALKTRSLLSNKDIRDLITIYDSEIALVDYAIGKTALFIIESRAT